MNKSHLTMLAAILILVLFAQLLGYWAAESSGSTAFYGTYVTPIFILTGFALWLVWKTPADHSKQPAYLYFWGQLVFNLLWAFTFFILKSPLLALLEVGLLLVFLLCAMNAFLRINKWGAIFLLPYFFWALAPLALTITTWNIAKIQ